MELDDRKFLAFRVPPELAEKYQRQAQREGHGTLSGWIVSVLNERILNFEKLFTSKVKPLKK